MAVAFHQRHLVVSHRLSFLWQRCPLSVDAELPAPRPRIQGGFEDVAERFGQPWVLDLSHDLDAAVPADLKAEIEKIAAGIKDGSISVKG